jgi:hypothetical protein
MSDVFFHTVSDKNLTSISVSESYLVKPLEMQ